MSEAVGSEVLANRRKVKQFFAIQLCHVRWRRVNCNPQVLNAFKKLQLLGPFNYLIFHTLQLVPNADRPLNRTVPV